MPESADLGIFRKSTDLDIFVKSADLAMSGSLQIWPFWEKSADLGIFGKSADLNILRKSADVAILAKVIPPIRSYLAEKAKNLGMYPIIRFILV